MLTATFDILPTGGAVFITAQADSDVTVSRSYDGGATYTQIGTLTVGAANLPSTMYFLDAGDGTQSPLLSNATYQYQLADTNGNSVTSEPLQPSASIIVTPQVQMTSLLLRILQAALNNMPLPSNYETPRIYHAMPLTGQPPLPLITLNQDLFQTSKVPSGQQIPAYIVPNQQWVVTSLAKWRYVVAVLTTTALEREFYRDALYATFMGLLSTPLAYVGLNVSHQFQATNGQSVGDKMNPGFYWSEIALEIEGTYNVVVENMPGLVNNIEFDVILEPSGIPAF